MVVTKGDVTCPPVVKTRLPKIAKSNRATGVWSRKISPAGLSYLKMDDEVRERERERKRENTFCCFKVENFTYSVFPEL